MKIPTMIHIWLLSMGFGPYVTEDKSTTVYENHPVSQGGTRITIVNEVAEVWNASKQVWDVIPTSSLMEFVWSKILNGD